MDLVNIPTQMAHNMKDIGLMINSTAKEKNIGLMELNTKETINTAKKTDLEISYGQINLLIAEILSIIIFTETEGTGGQMAENTVVIGSAIKCMAKAYSLGQTAESMKANTTMTKNKVTEFSHGRMAGNTTATG